MLQIFDGWPPKIQECVSCFSTAWLRVWPPTEKAINRTGGEINDDVGFGAGRHVQVGHNKYLAKNDILSIECIFLRGLDCSSSLSALRILSLSGDFRGFAQAQPKLVMMEKTVAVQLAFLEAVSCPSPFSAIIHDN
jgi:hypothetical protein